VTKHPLECNGLGRLRGLVHGLSQM